MKTAGTPNSISDTLARLSAHLDMLAGQIFCVEEALGTVLSDESSTAGISITRLQSLDFTRQSLEDCALMLQALSADPSAQAALENSSALEQKLKLDATKKLLFAKKAMISFESDGDVDLF